jgi:hypothetical protein
MVDFDKLYKTFHVDDIVYIKTPTVSFSQGRRVKILRILPKYNLAEIIDVDNLKTGSVPLAYLEPGFKSRLGEMYLWIINMFI